MSRNTDPTRGCTGKKKYRSFSYAEVIAGRSAETNGEPMHAYHCKHCNAFHVGAHFRRKKPEPVDDSEGVAHE